MRHTKGTRHTCDAAVIGAGVFGAWVAHHLRRTGREVVLLDAYGAANSRASSGGESRIIRAGYGPDEVYARWASRSLALWHDFFREAALHHLFKPTGVLWIARADDPYTLATVTTLDRVGVRFEKLGRAELVERFPQFAFEPDAWGVFESEGGVLMARRAVQAVVREAVARGVTYLPEAVAPPRGGGKIESVNTSGGLKVAAADYVFACGPWLPKLFPRLLEDLIRPTRQEVFFFGAGPGDRRFAPPAMPAWVDFGNLVYAVPDLESRGFKLAVDDHGPAFDPDSSDRAATAEGLAAARGHLARRIPSLRDAPLLEARVCQYENTPNGDFLIDRHPDFANVWLVGGGSGHGFKHGPALGEYVTNVMTGAARDAERRFTLGARVTERRRLVY